MTDRVTKAAARTPQGIAANSCRSVDLVIPGYATDLTTQTAKDILTVQNGEPFSRAARRRIARKERKVVGHAIANQTNPQIQAGLTRGEFRRAKYHDARVKRAKILTTRV